MASAVNRMGLDAMTGAPVDKRGPSADVLCSIWTHPQRGLEFQLMACVNLVKGKLLERDGVGVDVDGSGCLSTHDVVTKLKGRRRGEISTVGKRDRSSSPRPSSPLLCCLPGLDDSRSLLLSLKICHSIIGQKYAGEHLHATSAIPPTKPHVLSWTHPPNLTSPRHCH